MTNPSPLPAQPNRGLAALNRARIRCPRCGFVIAGNAFKRHLNWHDTPSGAERQQQPQRERIEGHHRCSVPGCEAWVNLRANRCYRHSERDERLRELDAMLEGAGL